MYSTVEEQRAGIEEGRHGRGGAEEGLLSGTHIESTFVAIHANMAHEPRDPASRADVATITDDATTTQSEGSRDLKFLGVVNFWCKKLEKKVPGAIPFAACAGSKTHAVCRGHLK